MEKIKTYFVPMVEMGPAAGKYYVLIEKEHSERFGKYLTELRITHRCEVDPDILNENGMNATYTPKQH